MIRLIPGLDRPGRESAQLGRFGEAVALALEAPQGTGAPSRRTPLHAVPVQNQGTPGARKAAGSGAAADPAPIDQLWAAYLDARDRAARDALVLRYQDLVRGVAGKLAGGLPTHVDLADLVQVGTLGLIDAVERFDPARGVPFASFASTRIRGAMLDELRAIDWVPRGVRSRVRELERAREQLEVRLGRSATDGELARELGVALAELRGMGGHLQLVSAEAFDEAGGTIADLLPDPCAPDPVEVAEHHDVLRGLVVAVGELCERDQAVVRLYYRENLTLAEIGRRLGVTESRVCQLHTRLVTRLRSRLEGFMAC